MSGVFLGASLVLSVIALVFVLFPLLRDAAARQRIQSRREVNARIHQDRIEELQQDLENGTLSRAQFDAAMEDLDRDLVQSGAVDPEDEQAGYLPRARRGVVVASAAVSAVAVPVLALLVYSGVGDADRAFSGMQQPQTPERGQQQQAGQQQQQAPQEHDTEEIKALAEQLRQRLDANPDDEMGWVLYARTMVFLEELEEARDAFAEAIELGADDDADLLAEYADVLAATTGNLQGEPEELLERALEIDPQNVRALWLAGTAAYNRQEFDTAGEYWEQLLDVVPPQSEAAQAIQTNLQQLPDRSE